MSKGSQKQAVIYCRVSDPKQAKHGHGLKSQETRCREYAQHKGYEVIEVFSDDFTGMFAERPAMSQMLRYLRKRRAIGTVVIIDDITRFARGLEAHLALRAAIGSAGGTLESPMLEFRDDADSKFLEHILATSAQHHREKNAEQTKNRMRARVMNGYWVFQAPAGYRYEAVPGRGKMLKREEPIASVVAEAFEGYANGRFETQADVARFLQDNPLFPKDATGIVRHMRVAQLFGQVAYAGLIEAPEWGVPLQPAQHEALVDVETFQRVQDRLNGIGRAAYRKNLNEDFALRGFVTCGCCGTPLTACWSKGLYKKYPYYLCPKQGCESYRKSIPRAQIEGEFEQLLRSVQPTETLCKVAGAMLEELWNRRLGQIAAERKALAAKLKQLENEVAQFLDRIVETRVPSVIAAYENRVRKIEIEKLTIRDRMAAAERPASSFNDTLRTAIDFLANPWNLWNSNRLEDRRTVLKLTFVERLQYVRNEGFRTANLSLPFKALREISVEKIGMARPKRFELLTF